MTSKEGTTTIIDGKAIAERWLDEIAVQVRALGTPLHLAAMCASPPAGGDSGLRAFVKLKQRAARSVGMEFSAYYPESETEAQEILSYLANDDTVHGVFLELPLPEAWDRDALLAAVPFAKDVDCIAPAGERSFYEDTASVLPPAVVALRRLLAAVNMDMSGRTVAVVGQGKLVGRPIAHWLERQGAEVVRIDIDTKGPEEIAVQADVLITGAGVPGLITGEWVREGATVVDFGYAKKGDTYVGDVDADSVLKKAGVMTPVPGGMGPLVIAATLENVLTVATK